MGGAAASRKDPSSRCIQHESLNRIVVSASSRSGLRALAADGLNDSVSIVETVLAPGHCVVSGGEDEGIFSEFEVIESDGSKDLCRRARKRSHFPMVRCPRLHRLACCPRLAQPARLIG